MMRIHRRALSSQEIQSLRHKCDFSHLELRVYTILDNNDKGEQIVILKQTRELNLSDELLAQPAWYTFDNFTDVYKADVETTVSGKEPLVTVRLSIGDTETCQGVTAAHLGFTSASGTESELIAFSKSDMQSSPFTSQIIPTLSAVYKRKKRSVNPDSSGMIDNTDVKFDNISVNITTQRPEGQPTLDNMKRQRCQLYSHTVSIFRID